MSALMAAAHRGALGSLEALLEAGATVNLADELGATGKPLGYLFLLA